MRTDGKNQIARRARKLSHRAFWLCVSALILGLVILDSIRPDPPNDPIVLAYAAVLATAAILLLVVYFIALALSQAIVSNDFTTALTGFPENNRPIILFLRSFDVAASGLGQRILEFFWLFQEMSARNKESYTPYDAEEEIDDAVFSYATFVAIGNKRVSYGATKIIVKDEDWQDTFRRLTASASLILMMPGPSLSVQWELSQILGSPLMQRTVLMMPRVGIFGTREANAWTETSKAFAREFQIMLPLYADDGCCFRLGADRKPSATVELEQFTHGIRKYFAHHATSDSFDIEEMWKSIV